QKCQYLRVSFQLGPLEWLLGSSTHFVKCVVQQLTHALNRDVRLWILRDFGSIQCIVPLARENGCHPRSPELFDRGEQAHLIVDHDVVLSIKPRFNIVEFVLLMNVDQHIRAEDVCQPRTVDFSRLKHDVAITQNHGRAPLFYVFDNVERIGVKTIGEWVVDHEVGNFEQTEVARIGSSVTLQRAKIVRVSKLNAELFENFPVMFLAFGTNVQLEMAPQIGCDAIVIKERVVDVEQERYRIGGGGDHQAPPDLAVCGDGALWHRGRVQVSDRLVSGGVAFPAAEE